MRMRLQEAGPGDIRPRVCPGSGTHNFRLGIGVILLRVRLALLAAWFRQEARECSAANLSGSQAVVVATDAVVSQAGVRLDATPLPPSG